MPFPNPGFKSKRKRQVCVSKCKDKTGISMPCLARKIKGRLKSGCAAALKQFRLELCRQDKILCMDTQTDVA